MNFIKPVRQGEKGFTLIELLIVVAILGILAAVIIPNVSTFLASGKVNAANTEEQNVKTAATAYYADNGTYPQDSTTLFADNYLAGTPTATYSFDQTYGWITAIASTPSQWAQLTFTNAGNGGPSGSDGKWVK